MRAIAWLLLWIAAVCPAAARIPVYIEDSHAGSFYWMVQNLPVNGDFALVLIDAHADANGIFGSDALRAQVLRAASDNGLEPLVARWRAQGRIQCYDWIEPLVPHPISRVYWVAGDALSVAHIARTRAQARDALDAHEAASPRADGRLGGRYEVLDLARLSRLRETRPLVVSIDLDYFADGERPDRLSNVLKTVMALEGLRAVTFSISRPYLASEAQSHRLLHETLRCLSRELDVDIHFEPFASSGLDRSLKAKSYQARGLPVPRYRVDRAPPWLQALILQNAERIRVDVEAQRWRRLLEGWRAPHVGIWANGARSDACLPAALPFEVRVEGGSGPIKWKVLAAEGDRYNLTGEQQGFADAAPRHVRLRELAVSGSGRVMDSVALLPFFDRTTGWGTVRVFCEVGGRVSNVACISRFHGDGYPARLTEIFNLPYVYGSVLLQADGRQSADARYGADCAHFVIYGKRREGRDIPYVNPRELLAFLQPLDEFREFRDGVAYGSSGPIALPPELVRDGVVIHFGKHVAAVFEVDGGGLLTARTRVVHQLETCPRITTFAALAARYKFIRVMKFKS